MAIVTLLITFSSLSASFEETLQKARVNDAKAQYDVASHYLLLQPETNENMSLALYWFETAAQNGYEPAQEFLSREYLSGTLGKKDDNLAIYWLTFLAIKGNTDAKLSLADYFKNTRDVPDLTEVWLKLAAADNDKGEAAYSNYLQNKFNQSRQNQLNDTQQLEGVIDSSTSNGLSIDTESYHTGRTVSDNGIFWIIFAIPLTLIVYILHLRRKLKSSKSDKKSVDSERNQERTAATIKIQKQKQQITLLFNELKRAKEKEEDQKLLLACAIFGFSPSSMPDKQHIKLRYKQLSKIYHPDMKGSDDEMKRLNQALKIILAQKN
ncbi:hypothetical protein OAP63_03080 [Vibrio sp.]|nr:hypothetical protein [Vibrio sp.]